MAILKAKQSRRKDTQKAEALTEAGKEDTKRLNAEIPVSLHRRTKSAAVNEARPMTDLIISALTEYLDNHDRQNQ